MDNGIKVASLDNGGAISKVAVAIKAGSRYEASTQLGLSHLIKNAAFIVSVILKQTGYSLIVGGIV